MSDEIKKIKEEKARWERTTLTETLKKLPERKENFTTISDLPVRRLYTCDDRDERSYLEEISFPGEYPFTRGTAATMYRGRLWTRRQVVGLI